MGLVSIPAFSSSIIILSLLIEVTCSLIINEKPNHELSPISFCIIIFKNSYANSQTISSNYHLKLMLS